MAKSLILIMFVLLTGAPTASGYEIVVVKSGNDMPITQVVRAFAQKLARLLPPRGSKTMEPYRFQEIDLVENPIKSAVQQQIRETRPDLILTVGRDALLTVRDIGEIPIVFLLVVAPEIIIQDHDNITGVNLDIPVRLQFDEVTRLLPGMRRIGVIYNNGHSAMDIQQARLDRPDLEFVALNAQGTRDVPGLLEELRSKVDIIWLLPDGIVSAPQILESYFNFSFQNRIPVLAFSEKYIKNGAAIVVCFDLDAMGEQAAVMAARILRGTSAGSMPPADITRVKTIVNPMVVRKLQLDIAVDEP